MNPAVPDEPAPADVGALSPEVHDREPKNRVPAAPEHRFSAPDHQPASEASGRTAATGGSARGRPGGESPRPATAEDAPELVRLRVLMLAAMAGGRTPPPGTWLTATEQMLRGRLTAAEPTLVAYVVDKPDRPGELAACAVGAIEQRLGSPENPDGFVGHISNVCTDPGYRRRGYSRACVTALLQWYRERGVPAVELMATEEGAPLYRKLGFAPRPAMRLGIQPAEAQPAALPAQD